MSEQTTERDALPCTCHPARIDGYLIHRQACARSVTKSKPTGVAQEVAQFNDLIPVGTPVLFWPGARIGEGTETKTRSRAWLLGDHTPVVMVEGYGGGIALTHVCPIPPDQVPCTCGARLVRAYPNDTGHHSTTECIDEATGHVIPPGATS